ncbi:MULTISPECIES: hypothetical protein [unclassified Mesorhizobium]|uniref:hypothetical protein n=1 Tax=unclassified Mesorhizobium TaxID=325217 RepID=UPI0003CEA45B|nr:MULTISPECIES: hypothetical protein [unclassified Mesorhizobium]ESY49026.1 hypothetical protein X745_28015 [Mesorhizobium sp. LNJC374B00]ESY52736.1 hypothetical protein X744_28585 [Mesorhizobium sp. LNJC372A00]WJI81458.1 hypothetical protein NLY34_01475 [Mesorhizobium sp. C374B]WJI87977.1 hypothetical protein NLY42_03890 [Mesorhizobium sp. C372A]
MAAFVKYETFIENLMNKLIDAFGSTDTWKAVIHTDAPTVATDNAVSDLTQIAGNNGYTTGGANITYNSTRTGGIVTATGADVVWTAAGGNLGSSTTGRYVSVYDDTSAGDNLGWSYDYGATFTVADGETFTLDFGASVHAMQ